MNVAKAVMLYETFILNVVHVHFMLFRDIYCGKIFSYFQIAASKKRISKSKI